MRQFVAIPAALTLAVASLSDVNDGFIWREVGQVSAIQTPKYTIRAGPVANSQSSAVSGTFQVLRTGAPSGIPSSRLAGACLIFPAADLGFEAMAAKRCQNDADCSTPSENAAGTCDGETNQCWSKPAGLAAGAALCNRGIVAAEGELNVVPLQPVDTRQFGIEPGAQVRVGACLNRSGIDPRMTGCLAVDGPDALKVLGPVSKIR